MLIDRVFTMPEFDEPGGQLNIGVATHEMAHALGEPDYYAVPRRRRASATGTSWRPRLPGPARRSNPTRFNPASRVFQGWVTPTIVHDDVRDAVAATPQPCADDGYTVGEPNPNLVLVPTKWIKVGETDEMGHMWTTNDVYGLVKTATAAT